MTWDAQPPRWQMQGKRLGSRTKNVVIPGIWLESWGFASVNHMWHIYLTYDIYHIPILVRGTFEWRFHFPKLPPGEMLAIMCQGPKRPWASQRINSSTECRWGKNFAHYIGFRIKTGGMSLSPIFGSGSTLCTKMISAISHPRNLT